MREACALPWPAGTCVRAVWGTTEAPTPWEESRRLLQGGPLSSGTCSSEISKAGGAAAGPRPMVALAASGGGAADAGGDTVLAWCSRAAVQWRLYWASMTWLSMPQWMDTGARLTHIRKPFMPRGPCRCSSSSRGSRAVGWGQVPALYAHEAHVTPTVWTLGDDLAAAARSKTGR